MAHDCQINLTKGSGCIFKMHRCFLLGRGKDKIPQVWLFRNVRALQKDALIVLYARGLFQSLNPYSYAVTAFLQTCLPSNADKCLGFS